MTRQLLVPLSLALALALWFLAPVELGYYTWPVSEARAGVDGAGGVPSDGGGSVPATPAAVAAEDAVAPVASTAAPVVDSVTVPEAGGAPHVEASKDDPASGAGASAEHPIIVRDSAEAPPLALDLPALAGAGAGALVASAAGALVHAVARKRKGKRLARVLRAATPWAKLVVGTAVGAGLAAALSGAALPAALAYGVAAGISAIAGRQLIVKPINISREVR